MARTVNRTLHTVRREAFLDVGQRLIQTKGYEEMSIQDVLDELDTSRGAFYHYFDSKQALLESVVDRLVDDAMARVLPVAADPNLPALRKLERVFSGIASLKAERQELVLAIIEVWRSDSNAIVREKVRHKTVVRLVPILAAVVAQGAREGTFAVDSPAETARILVSLMQAFQDLAIEQFIGRQTGTISFEVVRKTSVANTEACERILGVTRGSLTLIDQPTLHLWFG
jgi:AcrR family transcriptional regulator